MAATQPAVDHSQFHCFSPLDRLPLAQVEELLAYSRVERVPPGRRLFARGDTDAETMFLLSGQIALVADGPAMVVRAATPEARFAVADSQPRSHTAIARTSATVLCINTAVLDDLLRRSQTPTPVPTPAELPASDDAPLVSVPTAEAIDAGAAKDIFDSPPFAGLPHAHLQVLKARMTKVAVQAGDVVLTRGEECRHFHIIDSGRFRAGGRRRRGAWAGGTLLLPGDCFGEDALIANEPAEATITADSDGSLLRVSRGEFLTLIARHYIKWIAWRDLPGVLQQGACLLDVRGYKAFLRRHLPGSINFPLPLLQRAASTLDTTRCYVVCGDQTRRSAAAAFLLARQGLKVRILIEGVKAVVNAG